MVGLVAGWLVEEKEMKLGNFVYTWCGLDVEIEMYEETPNK